MADLKYTIAFSTAHGVRYLSSISSFCCGERYLGYFDTQPSVAMPMSHDKASFLCDHFRKEIRGYNFVVVPVPWSRAPVEVSPHD